MDSLYVIRERMQDLYSRYSIVADKAIQFVLAVMTFYMINNNVGSVSYTHLDVYKRQS